MWFSPLGRGVFAVDECGSRSGFHPQAGGLDPEQFLECLLAHAGHLEATRAVGPAYPRLLQEPVAQRCTERAGEVWSARSYDGASTYAAGQTIAVLKIEGATALVG